MALVVTELSGRLRPSAQIPSISILDEILLICKQPRVNSFYRARLSPLSTRPEGINTNMKNLDSIPRRPHRRLSLHTNRITSQAHAITVPGGEASTEHSISGGGRGGSKITSAFAFSGSRLISGEGWREESELHGSRSGDLVNIPITLRSFHPFPL